MLAALAVALGAVPGARHVHANVAARIPTEVSGALPDARLQGQARLRFLGLAVYDARLWVGEREVGADWMVPLALEIEYLRALEGDKIAERSIVEMRRQGEIDTPRAARWLQAMQGLFPDVKEGDRLTGVLEPGVGARFFLNGASRGEVREPEFARRFFGIWLAPQTSEPRLRSGLLGRAAS
jgi:hypothetical protein